MLGGEGLYEGLNSNLGPFTLCIMAQLSRGLVGPLFSKGEEGAELQ